MLSDHGIDQEHLCGGHPDDEYYEPRHPTPVDLLAEVHGLGLESGPVYREHECQFCGSYGNDPHQNHCLWLRIHDYLVEIGRVRRV